jgi:hypothetical protein
MDACQWLCGVRISHGAHIDSLRLPDYDLLRLGEGALVGRDAYMLGHLGTQRGGAWLVSQEVCALGARSAAGPRSVMLAGFHLKEDASLEPLGLGAAKG